MMAVDIVLKNAAGEDVTYSGVEQIKLNTADGGTQLFSLGEKAKLQEKTVTENGEVLPDEGYDGLSKVTVDVPIPDGYIQPSGTKAITANGTYDVTNYASVSVNTPTAEAVAEYDGTITVV